MKHLFKNVVVVACLLALGAFGAWLWFRPQLPETSTFHDGESTRSARQLGDVRLAVWSPPLPFDASLRSGEIESDVFVDENSGAVYFTLGTPGQDQDLYCATPGPLGGYEVQPIDALNTEYDESGPSLHQGFLYFSSNRPGGAGGDDLYRSRWTPNGFLAPENLGDAVNGPGDERDPVFRPRTQELYFSTNRDGAVGTADFDLAFSTYDGIGFSDVGILGEVATAYDERSPCFGPSGSLLVFASDRPDGAGGFDLYRALHMGRTFENVQNLGEPNGPGDEWAPTLTDGGFSVLFSSDRGADGRGDLYLAETQELYPLPDDGISLLDFTILLALALIALLAYLARRWEALDIIYKCLLLSVLVHLLLLWLSKRVDIEVEETAPGEDIEVYEVQLLQDVLAEVTQLEDVERGEQVDAPEPTPVETSTERQRTELAQAEVAARPMEALTRPSPTTPDSAPAPRAANPDLRPQHRRDQPSTPDLQTPQETFERLAGAAPSMEVARSETSAQPRAAESQATRQSPSLETLATSTSANDATLARPSNAPSAAPRAVDRSHTPQRPARSMVVAVEVPSDRQITVTEAQPTLESTTSDVAERLSAPELTTTPARAESRATPSPLSDVATAPRRQERAMSNPQRRVVSDPLRRSGPSAAAPARPSPSELREAVAMEAPSDRVATELGSEAGSSESMASMAALAAAPARAASEAGPSREAVELSDPAGRSQPRSSSEIALAPRELAATPERSPSRSPTRSPSLRDTPAPVGMPELSDRMPVDPSLVASATGASSAAVAAMSELPARPGAVSSTAVERQRPERPADPSTSAPAPGATIERASGMNRTARGTRLMRDPLAHATPLRRPIDPGLRAPGPPAAATQRTPTTTRGQALAIGPTAAAPMPSSSLQQFQPLRPEMGRLGAVSRDPVPDRSPLALRVDRTPDTRRRSPLADDPDRLSQLYSRRRGSAKEEALREGGGSAETERAVLSGLRYLAGIQREDGSFGDPGEGSDPEKYRDVRIGKTALAALAFLGAGHDPKAGTEFSPNTSRAIRYLVDLQDPRSGHFGNSDGYGHGISTYALAECYALNKDRDLVAPLLRATRHIQNMQLLQTRDRKLIGGWPYYYPDGPGVDPWPRASLSSWQAMALESAKVAGLPVDEASLAAAKLFFVNCYDERYGYFRYNHDPDWLNNPNGYRTLPATTPAAMFVLNILGLNNHSILDRGAEYVMERSPRGFFYRSDDRFARDGVGNLYFWYYATLAMYMRGGADWRRWNEAMKQTLLPAQKRDGSWDPISIYARSYAGADANERTYTTAMCVLMLEVYYRYTTPQLQRHSNR